MFLALLITLMAFVASVRCAWVQTRSTDAHSFRLERMQVFYGMVFIMGVIAFAGTLETASL